MAIRETESEISDLATQQTVDHSWRLSVEMGCCSAACFYKSRIFLLATLACLEAIFGIFRAVIFFAPGLSSDGSFDLSNVANITDHIAIAFVLDGASSIISVFTGLFVLFFLFLAPFLFCCVYCYSCCRSFPAEYRRKWFGSLFNVKAMHRFIAWDCNCPCYRPRPKLRFKLRRTLLIFCLLSRAAAIYLYYSLFGKKLSLYPSLGLSM